MKAGHGIPDQTLAQITDVMGRFPEVERVILFGSRAKSTHRRGSDIDLALVGRSLDWRTVGNIDTALDDLPTPYSFSLVIFDEKLDPSVAAHIRRAGIPLITKESAVEHA